MIVLGLSGAVSHDASAALLVDGELVAAAEEERFIRDKHAKGRQALNAARYCLQQAGIRPDQVDAVAYPYAPIGLRSPARWHYAARHWYAPDRALTALFDGNRRYRRNRRQALAMLGDLGFAAGSAPFVPVEHHLAHASSAYHLSGFDGKVAILGLDGRGEYATTFFGYGEGGRIHKLTEFYEPDSLGGLYGAITEYLGFEMLDGEFKVMGMAPYGDPDRFDFSRLLRCDGRRLRVNNRLVNVVGLRRHKRGGKGYFFSPELVRWLGPPRDGDAIDEPYIHYAAAVQRLLEETALKLVQHHLGPVLAQGGKLAYAGGVALNVKLNQRLMALPQVEQLFVQPAAGDAGTAIGAATYVAATAGDAIKPLQHVYLGPDYSTEECLAACAAHGAKPHYRRLENTVATAADILAAGNPLAWFQGRMEFGPRALGNRSILGNPSHPGVAERINAQIKYRERWRPFCPSVSDRVAADIIGTDHPAPYMTFTFDVAPHWKNRIPEVVHEDGTARVQIVSADTNPRYHALLDAMAERTGNAVLLNTSLNRRGEPM
uniref:carbamoyltransferase family protein n=1 Tax=Immundisolibacter sp. TaxID=1934948 RepID=UPI003569D4A4